MSGPDEVPGAGRSIRNVGICAHIDAGKTTLTERILHVTGRERYVGRVDEGTSVMDWMAEERERGITIAAAATRVSWADADVNLVDTPGHVDFTVEVERCMRVLDGAVLVLDATRGVEPQTETVWRQVAARGLPAIAFANKCERPGADVLGCARSISERLGARAVNVAYPVGGGDTEEELSAIIDLVHMRAWGQSRAGQRQAVEVAPESMEEAAVLRAELVDVLADHDEVLFEAVCDGRDPGAEEVMRSLRTLTLARVIVPLFCGAALPGHGVPLLLDGVASLLPAPDEAAPPEVFDASSGGPQPGAVLPEPLALCFKVHSRVRRGVRRDLTFVRVHRGEIVPGTRLWNGRSGVTEEVDTVLRIHASEVEHVEGAAAGDIVALGGLRATGTGDTLVAEGSELRLEPPRVPTPVLGVLVEPRRDEERIPLRDALEQLAREDPSLKVSEDRASGQWLLEGMGELHIDIAVARLGAEFGVEPRLGPPRVAFREVVRLEASGAGTVERTLEGARVHAEVELRLEPLPEASSALEIEGLGRPDPGEDFILDGRAWRGVRAALRAEAGSGPLAGHPLCGTRIRLGAARSVSGGAPGAVWEQAAVAALREALKAAVAAGGVELLEPWMAFTVETPDDVSSGVIGDLNARHASMEEIVSTGTQSRRVSGTAPLRELIGYSTELRSLSKGRATFDLAPAGLAPSPSSGAG